ncbi:MAG: hypothetical protein CVV64_10800 [Candidatus Wallbacteria bacterium HGW-Wallbacteria-1]|jgi:type II secretory pathway pseudopilin PulG|uniref:Prepilin-type N-terminal cleavage/methylation domain-containing protein n=1 Tax=Candidatus Wallbacteria bacterium HGW-Wallbacteria-1 TaxID=2013854 RepID=A0A2N1PPE0_9BACT|nr:MAG: hypothetical protein CVV64_10800 [Candidatus Wallbacteria bacterium HGW-Wallbacteria-1]
MNILSTAHFPDRNRLRNIHFKRESGLSLPEVLVALAIFMILVAPIFSVFRSSKTQVNASQDRLTAFLIGRKVMDSVSGALYNSGAVRLENFVPQLGETDAKPVNDGSVNVSLKDNFNFIKLGGGGSTSRYFVKLMDRDDNFQQDDRGISQDDDQDLYQKLENYRISVVTSTYSTGFFPSSTPSDAGFIADDAPYSNPDPGLCQVFVTVDWTNRDGQEKEVRLSSLITTKCPETTPPGEDDRPAGALEGF